MDMNSMKFAHDMRMPIQLIYSCVQLLEMEISPNAKANGYLQMLVKSADQLQSMISGVLEDRPAGGPALRLKVRDVVADARSISRQCALLAREKGIQLHFETNAARFCMPADGEKLQRILHNLLSNALRFTREGGHVAVGVRVLGDAIEFAVTDDGCGIEAKKQAEIFEIGVTDGGNGYGLPIAREYARQLGGDVTVQSHVGRGSRFTLRLPVPGANALA